MHVNVTEEQLAAGILAGGMPKDYATVLAAFYLAVKNGAENQLNDVWRRLPGRSRELLRVLWTECVEKVVWGDLADAWMHGWIV